MIKIIDNTKEEEKENIESPMEQKEEPSMREQIKKIYDIFESIEDKSKKKGKKPKKFKIPQRGRVSKSKAKKGWMIIEKINENRNISFEKQQVEMEVYKTADGIYHATDGREIFFYKGMPLVHQPGWRQNPYDPLAKPSVPTENIPTQNNVYGQKPIIAKMTFDTYKEANKKKGGGASLLVVLGILVGGYLILHYLFHLF
jgi:hypothetical protein